MALFPKGGGNPLDEINQLRAQGLSDNQIIDELKSKGYPLPQINDALAQSAIAGSEPDMGAADQSFGMEESYATEGGKFGGTSGGGTGSAPAGNLAEDLHSRVEEIAESIIDEKWDLLIEEVKKIIEWKDKVEDEVKKLTSDMEKVKEDFKALHQGVLGKLETYDEKMGEVGTELKAVGKVFKEVVPEFVENVKELKAVTKEVKKGKR